MTELHINLFGQFEVLVGGATASGFDSDKVRALLAFLVVEADRPHQREMLAGLLWPESTEGSARTNLRRALSNLRQVIGDHSADPPYLIASRQSIRFNTESSFWLDVKQFRDCAGLAARSDSQIKNLERAAELYKGGLLEGFSLRDSAPFYEWQLITKESLEQQALELFRRLAGVYEELGLFDRSLEVTNRILIFDPWNEQVHRQKMRLLALTGRKVEAGRHFDEMAAAFQEELGIELEAKTIELNARLASGQFEADDFQLGKRSIRGYQLREKVGSGSFGIVYRAYQPAVKRDVAVKIIRPDYASQPDFIRRFDVEAEIIARLEHPHIVPLYDYWREPDGAYIVMRWLKGGNLKTALKRGPWHPETALSFLDELASALDAAHRQGVIHRDIKPANILLDGDGHAYLSDFGIAALEDNVQMPGLQVVTLSDSKLSGTPEYISPEQVRKEKLTQAADIYALGIVAFEMMAGCHPFHESPIEEMLRLHVSEPLPQLTTLRPDIPGQIDEVLGVATAKTPGDRYPDAAAFSAALRSAIVGGVLQRFPSSFAPRFIVNPYKGLRPFQESDADNFYGRESLVSSLLQEIESGKSPEERFLAVVGPSGSGKSSLVKAGLLPAIRSGALPGSEKWFIAEMAPGSKPFEELESALLAVSRQPLPNLLGTLKESPGGFHLAVQRALRDPESRLLLVIDQFEELFLLTSDPQVQSSFVDGLFSALNHSGSQLLLIITLRADCYDRPLHFLDFGELLRRKTEVVLPLSSAELVEAVEKPASKMGVSFEDGLVNAILEDVQQEPGALPLLQFALTELFERRRNSQLTLEEYSRIGGVAGAVGRSAEELYEGLSDSEKEAAQQIFIRLVVPGLDLQDSRRRVLRSELTDLRFKSLDSQPVDLSRLVERFGRSRLLTFDRDPASRAPTVEIAHEALLREWTRLRIWINEYRRDIELYQQLQRASADWFNAEKETSFLLRGERLRSTAEWLSASNIAVTSTEADFIEASLTKADSEAASEKARLRKEQSLVRRTRYLVLILAAVLIFALIGAAAGALIIGSDLTAEVAQAITSPERNFAPPIASESTRIASLTANMELSIEQGRGVEYSPDGRFIAISGFDNNATLRDASSGEIVREFHGHQDQVNNITISDDQNRIATTSKDGTVKVWDLNTGAEIQSVGGARGELVSPELSPNGKLVVATNFNSDWQRLSAHIWDVESGEELMVIGYGEFIGGLDFHPDGQHVVVPGEDGRATMWDINSGEQVGIFSGHDGMVTDLVFSTDGKLLVTASTDGAVRIFDVPSTDLRSTFRGSRIEIYGVDISVDGSRIAAALADGSVRVFDSDSGREIRAFYGHESAALNVSFSPDGLHLASGGDDNTTVIWNLAGR